MEEGGYFFPYAVVFLLITEFFVNRFERTHSQLTALPQNDNGSLLMIMFIAMDPQGQPRMRAAFMLDAILTKNSWSFA